MALGTGRVQLYWISFLLRADLCSIASARGPMSTSRQGIELFMKTYLDSCPWEEDDLVVRMPWAKKELPARLKIAVMWDDGIVKPHPPVARALKEVVEACKAAGMEVVDWTPVDHDKAWQFTSALYFEDGGKGLRSVLDEVDEPMMPLTKWFLEGPNVKYRTTEDVWEVKIHFLLFGNRLSDSYS